MASIQVIQVSIDQPPSSLTSQLTVGRSVVWVSSRLDLEPWSTNTNDGSALKLQNGKDVLLHIAVRRDRNTVEFNTRADGQWNPNVESIPLKGLFKSNFPTIAIYNDVKHYIVTFDNRTTYNFTKRIPSEATAVSYTSQGAVPPGPAGSAPVFSNPIGVVLFDCKRAPMLSLSFCLPFLWSIINIHLSPSERLGP